MHPSVATSNQTIQNSIIGSAYVHEEHLDQEHCYLAHTEAREFVADFSQILKALRAALSLR
jgi:hypothetical protein